MDAWEKLVELVGQVQDCGCDVTDVVQMNYVENITLVDHLIANGVTVQEWIPVSEPPKEKGTYIVCTDRGGVLLGHWYGKEWNVGGGAKKHLAYWMKKPQPPKGE